MAAIKKTEMKAMDEAKVRAKLSEIRIELMRLNAQIAVGSNIESPGRIKSARRNIARLLTLINLINSRKKIGAKIQIKENKGNKKEVNKKA